MASLAPRHTGAEIPSVGREGGQGRQRADSGGDQRGFTEGGEQTAAPAGFTLKSGEEEKERILRALKQADGNKRQAAKLPGIGRTTLYNKPEEYGIEDS